MSSKIVETLELMCDKENVQDKKILLLAELVETRYDALGKNQEGLKKSLESTNEKLDRLTILLEKYETDTHGCPVYKNREYYERLSFFVKHPKLFLILMLGIFGVIGGFFGVNVSKFIEYLLGI